MSCSSCRQFGGALGMPLSYLNRNYTEPSASEGSNLLQSQVGLARSVINPTGGKRKLNTRKYKKADKHTRKCKNKCKKSGGFYPSVMGSFIQNAARLMPAAAITGYRMTRNYNKTRRHR